MSGCGSPSVTPSVMNKSRLCSPPQSSNLNQLLEKMKQGEHAFNVNADVEPDADEAPDFGDHFDADGDDGGAEECGDAFDERKDACSRRSPEKGR